MDSIKRGFGFFKQAWQMAFADRDLLKPTIYALIVGFIVTLIGLVPLVAAGIFFQSDQGIGQIVFIVLGAILAFAQYTVTYVFSSMTIYLIYGYLTEGDGRMDKAWAIVRRDFFDILTLSAASTGVKLLENFVRGKGNRAGRGILANLIRTVWTEATYLVLPAMVIEDIGLKDGLKRATAIVKGNLLLVGVSTVGVGWITGLIGLLLGTTGIGFGLVSVTEGSTVGLIAGITLDGAVAMVFILVAVLIGNYTMTAYHTCLYLWARDVEKAQDAGLSLNSVAAPKPLAAIL